MSRASGDSSAWAGMGLYQKQMLHSQYFDQTTVQ
ncbi:hypothetical protein SAMN05216299_109108 [Nitrosospira sp. Nsp14]|nr:hypothetical protein SAMN05216299_109108 [Nitrosospira sp. Nsp14]